MKNKNGRTGNVASRLFKRFLRDDRGQTTAEYILILSVVVLVALKFKGKFQKTLDAMITKLDGDLNSAVDGDGGSN